jgi:hypothetical protein
VASSGVINAVVRLFPILGLALTESGLPDLRAHDKSSGQFIRFIDLGVAFSFYCIGKGGYE